MAWYIRILKHCIRIQAPLFCINRIVGCWKGGWGGEREWDNGNIII